MKNYVQKGSTVTLTAPYTVVSGAGALVGSLFGVAVTDITSGADGEFQTDGVFDLLCPTGDTINQGQDIYWDNSAKKATETAASNYKIGAAIAAKGSGPTTVRVRLNGVSVVVTP